jgi:hypothetical protein
MRKTWIVRAAIALGLILLLLLAAGFYVAHHFEPYVREKTVAYLERRFHARVELANFHASVNLQLGLRAQLEGLRLIVPGEVTGKPFIAFQRAGFDVDLPALLRRQAKVRQLRIEGLEINVPPKGQRLHVPKETAAAPAALPAVEAEIGEIVADGTVLRILPKDPARAPLQFDILKLTLQSAARGQAMRYDAQLTNAKPPGLIHCVGTFGPWNSEDLGETPLTGDYDFRNADLGVFKGIAGILSSQGKFAGVLGDIIVDGTTDVPDFRLKSSGNPVPLKTKFHANVDGTNGNTFLDPVEATLDNTEFAVKGMVARFAGEKGKTVALDVVMKKGEVQDLLRLAVKDNDPFLKGGVDLTMQFELPPGHGEVADRLIISGKFALKHARFNSPAVQGRIDELSRRGQGKPADMDVNRVPMYVAGQFRLRDGVITLPSVQFAVNGARVQLAGTYGFRSEQLDFHGKLYLAAHASEMLTGWKRILAKPFDPFLAREGAGVVLPIRIAGPRTKPEFGLDR